jgi:hypothetical protein
VMLATTTTPMLPAMLPKTKCMCGLCGGGGGRMGGSRRRRRRRRRGCRPFFLDPKSVVRERDIVWHRFVVFHSLRMCLILGVFTMYVLPYHISCHIIYRWREIGDITTIDSCFGAGVPGILCLLVLKAINNLKTKSNPYV